jgi:hypothetical protein
VIGLLSVVVPELILNVSPPLDIKKISVPEAEPLEPAVPALPDPVAEAAVPDPAVRLLPEKSVACGSLIVRLAPF